VREGSINTIGTDNTSRARATKRPEAGLHWRATGPSGAWERICPRCCITVDCAASRSELLVDRATRAPAQVYGIYPQKGTIAVGSDA
jgi:dihydroorotase-like cyclic amidohydrolase